MIEGIAACKRDVAVGRMLYQRLYCCDILLLDVSLMQQVKLVVSYLQDVDDVEISRCDCQTAAADCQSDDVLRVVDVRISIFEADASSRRFEQQSMDDLSSRQTGEGEHELVGRVDSRCYY